MGTVNQTRYIERLKFFNGQRAFAEDIQAVDDFNHQMRCLHNRSLHQPGIGVGYAVSANKGDRQVTIGAGYAIDDQGQEIVLTRDQVEQVPPVAGAADGGPAYFDLTVQYPDDSSLVEVEYREGLCETGDAVRLQEAPVFCWVPLKKVQRNQLTPQNDAVVQEIIRGKKIVLARVEVFNCQVQRLLLTEKRRDARPDCSPYIASGEVFPVEWERLELKGGRIARMLVRAAAAAASEEEKYNPLIIKTTISTKEAGFETAPKYSVNLLTPTHILEAVDGGKKDANNQDLKYNVLLLTNTRILEPKQQGNQSAEEQSESFTLLVTVYFELVLVTKDMEQPQPEINILNEAAEIPPGGGEVRAAAAFDSAVTNDELKTIANYIYKKEVPKWRVQWMGVEG